MAQNNNEVKITFKAFNKDFNNAMSQMNAETRKANKEMALSQEQLKENGTESDKLIAKLKGLERQQSIASEKTKLAREQLERIKATFGENSVEAQRLEDQVLTLSIAEQKLANQVTKTTQDISKHEQATRDFNNTLGLAEGTVNDFADALGADLTRALNDGTANSKQLERAIGIIGRSALNTEGDITRLRTALREVDDGSSLEQVRQDLSKIGQEATNAEKDVSGLGSALGGLAAGGGIAGTLATALDVSSLNTQIEISMNLNEADTATVRKSIMETTAAIGDEEAAYEGVRRQMTLNKDASAEANAEIIKGASTIAYAYKEIDFKELIQESHEIGKELGITQKEALGLVNGLLDVGFPPEQLDIIAEYGSQLKMAGYSAEQIQGILAAGVDTGTWNIDILMDGLKEGRIVAAEFGQGVDDAMKDAIKGTTISAQQLEKWGQAVAAGGQDGVKAMQEMNQALSLIDDDTKRNELGVKMYGTLWEEQGGKISQTIQGMNEHIRTAAQNTTELNSDMSALDSDPAYRLSVAMGSIKEALAPILASIGELIAKIATLATENITLIATIVAIGTVIGVLVGAFALLMPAIGALITAWPILAAGFGAISAPITIAVGAIGLIGAALVTLWQNSETFRENITSIFESVREITMTVFEAIASFIGEKTAQIVQFWQENGQQILQAVENVFNAVKGIIDFVMPAIQFLIETVWTAIQNIINGALDVIMGVIKTFSGLLTGDFSKMWEGIKQIFKGAIDVIVGWVSLSFVGGIRTLLTNLSKTAINLIRTKWNTIVNLFKSAGTNSVSIVKSMVTSVISFVKNLATNFVNTISNMKTNVVNKMTEIKDGIISKVKSINLVQIGKDIINGLIKGISNMSKAAIESVTGVVDGVINKAKSLLGIKSPSRVFKQIGLWTGEGMAIGLNSSSKTVNTAMSNIGDGIIAVSNAYQKEHSKIIDEHNKKNEDKNDKTLEKIYKIQNNAAKKKRKLTKQELQDIALLEASYRESKLKTEGDYQKKYKALLEKSEKEYLEVIKSYIADKKSLEELSMIEEAAIWEQSMELFAEGTTERIKAQQEYKKALEQVEKEISGINENSLTKMQNINDELIKNEQALNDGYQKVYDDRVKDLVNYKSVFDEFTIDLEKSGVKLLENLQSQVDGFRTWQHQFSILSGKGVLNDALLKELEAMGPNAVSELIALNQLTNEQLSQYSSLYEEKSKMAREQAEKELVGLKEDTRKQIDALRNTANQELTKVQVEWDAKIKGIVKSTNSELTSLKTVGENAGNGLLKGLSNTAPAIQNKATEIAESIKKTIQSVLDIHSPSRVTYGFGVNVNEGFILGLEKTKARIQKVMSNIYGAMPNRLNNVASGIDVNRQVRMMDPGNLNSMVSQTVSNQSQSIVHIQSAPVILDGKQIAEVTFDTINGMQYRTAKMAGLMKGVVLP